MSRNQDFWEIDSLDVTGLSEEDLFVRWLSRMPEIRRNKVASLRHAESQRLSLGVGILLQKALWRHGVDARDAAFELNEFEKPSLKDMPNLHFSLSHAGNYALCAVSSRPVGCDVERLDRGEPRLAERFFSPEEQRYLSQAADRTEWNLRFTRIWTRKESCGKALGRGLNLPLREFSVLGTRALSRAVIYSENGMLPGCLCSSCLLAEEGEETGFPAAVWRTETAEPAPERET